MLFERDSVEEIVKAGLSRGPRVVAVKRGAGGAVVGDGHGLVHQPAARIDQAAVREAVGAGDAFDAGLLDQLSLGADLAAATRFATACAAVTLSGRGGAEAIDGRTSVEAALKLVPESTVTAWP